MSQSVSSPAFKAPSRPPVDTIILKKFNEFWSVYSRVRVRLNQNAQFWARKLKTWPVSLAKNSGSPPGTARKILQLQRGRKVTKHGTVSAYLAYPCISTDAAVDVLVLITNLSRLVSIAWPQSILLRRRTCLAFKDINLDVPSRGAVQ